MSAEQNARRIFENIKVLLQVGQFPGEVAVSLAEAQQLVAQMTAEPKPEAPNESEKEAGSSVRSEKGAGRLDNGGVSPARRQGRKRKAE